MPDSLYDPDELSHYHETAEAYNALPDDDFDDFPTETLEERQAEWDRAFQEYLKNSKLDGY